jgi:hypothetical protein
MHNQLNELQEAMIPLLDSRVQKAAEIKIKTLEPEQGSM